MDVKRLDPLMRYQEYAEYQFSLDGEGLGLRAARDALSEAVAQSQDVRELDEIVIEATQVNEYINPGLLEDDASRPLAHWWWHIGKLRNRTYPAHLLPEHLRAVYEQAADEAA
ncbi:hypothetical protein [Thiocystis minor]|uniref:hypothetical protein n=1 Tax=Thiocystis minor TaxID=61597 RepID=UPI001914CFB3|nr:hypothetical protein [Thiocystis minor]